MSQPRLFWDGVLAGRYVDKDLKKMVCHAVAAQDFKIGRIARTAGEVLCKRVPPTAMSTGGATPNERCPACPRCAELAAKLNLEVEAS